MIGLGFGFGLGLGPGAPAFKIVAPEPTGLAAVAAWVESYKNALVVPALAAILFLVWLFFHNTWRELDEDAHRHRAESLSRGKWDARPLVALAMTALILAMQEQFGGRQYFDIFLSTQLTGWSEHHPWIVVKGYEELWGFAWWSTTRIGGYMFPFVVWKIFFRQDSLRDLGLRSRGFWDHAWIYGLFLTAVLPAMLVVSRSPDFGAYYPFYKLASRSWFDFLTWEAMYFCQFFALEMFFRGFWLGALRKSFGSGAIFAMAVPYCMIHFGKPYLEVCGAIIAGIALGSLSMKTKSIYQGFMVHVTVAGLMDWLSLRHRNATPLYLWPIPPNQPAATGLGFLAEEQHREALARTIERTAGSIFAILFLCGVIFVLRARRRRLARI